MKITKINTTTLRHKWGDTTRDSVILHIESDNGLIGISRGGDPKIISEILTPLLIGEDPRNIMKLWYLMYQEIWKYRKIKLDVIKGSISLGAIDIALWDIKGKAFNTPVYKLLGGPVRDKVVCYPHNTGTTIDELINNCKSSVENGWKFVRWGQPETAGTFGF